MGKSTSRLKQSTNAQKCTMAAFADFGKKSYIMTSQSFAVLPVRDVIFFSKNNEKAQLLQQNAAANSVFHLKNLKQLQNFEKATSAVYLVDAGLPRFAHFLDDLKNLFPNKKTAVALSTGDFDIFLDLVRQGQRFFINLDVNPTDLNFQLEKIASDGAATVVPAGYETNLLGYIAAKESQLPTLKSCNLKEKEHRVLLMLAAGKTYDEAATALDMKIDIFRYYIKKLYKKLGATNKIQALRALHAIREI